MILNGLKGQKLEKVNADNLLHGKDSEGGLMPPYSSKYQNNGVFYRDYKMSSNPLNQGRWDLKHWWNKKYDGLFYKSIQAKINSKQIVFDTSYDPKYMSEIYYHKSKKKILGITKQQMKDAQEKNIPIVKPKLLKIINGS